MSADIIERAEALELRLRLEAQDDASAIVTELIGALKYQRALNDELSPLVSGVKLRLASERATRRAASR